MKLLLPNIKQNGLWLLCAASICLAATCPCRTTFLSHRNISTTVITKISPAADTLSDKIRFKGKKKFLSKTKLQKIAKVFGIRPVLGNNSQNEAGEWTVLLGLGGLAVIIFVYLVNKDDD